MHQHRAHQLRACNLDPGRRRPTEALGCGIREERHEGGGEGARNECGVSRAIASRSWSGVFANRSIVQSGEEQGKMKEQHSDGDVGERQEHQNAYMHRGAAQPEPL
eukprot:3097530-Prymnesium_polylepis.2